jgi:hypothetical protein
MFKKQGLAHWTVRIRVVTTEARKSGELEERPGHGPDPSFCTLHLHRMCLTRFGPSIRLTSERSGFMYRGPRLVEDGGRSGRATPIDQLS